MTGIVGKEKPQNRYLEDDSDEEDLERQWKLINKSCHYLPSVLTLAKVKKKHPLTLQQLLEAKYLDPECRQTLKIVGKPRSSFTVDVNALLARVASLDGTVQIQIPHFTTL